MTLTDIQTLDFQNTLDINRLLYPKDKGLYSLENYIYGGTSISTEDVWTNINERASSVFIKVSEKVEEAIKYIWSKRYWSLGGLTIAAGASIVILGILRKGKDDTSKIHDKQQAASIKDTVVKSMKDIYTKAKEKIASAKKKEEPVSKDKAKSILTKLVDALKKLVGLSKDTSSAASRAASTEGKPNAGNELFPEAALVVLSTIGLSMMGAPLAVGLIVGLIAGCVCMSQGHTAATPTNLRDY